MDACGKPASDRGTLRLGSESALCLCPDHVDLQQSGKTRKSCRAGFVRLHLCRALGMVLLIADCGTAGWRGASFVPRCGDLAAARKEMGG